MTAALLEPRRTNERLSGPAATAYVGAGLLAGVGYGALLRLWMRFVTTEPEFSWSGTLFIVGAFAILGTSAGIVTAGRRRGWRGLLVATRTVGIALSLGCFGGAGIVMLPTIVPAGLAIGRHDWSRGVRVVLVGLAVLTAAAVVLTMTDLSLARRAVALVAYLALCSVEACLVAALYAPSARRGAVGRLGRPVLIGSGALLVVLVALQAVGV
ncbi:MAG TPA: hypothetical protein VFK43_05025 [Acidimicrobiales bacterium]|nr:hypothetical protein [Acidimicrobiales bacterium]